jgi:hypothetical protein
LIAQNRNHLVGPESRPIFLHPPAFIYRPAFRCRYFQFHFRLAALNIFGGIKTGEVLADDLT